jgi:hypothetical protein
MEFKGEFMEEYVEPTWDLMYNSLIKDACNIKDEEDVCGMDEYLTADKIKVASMSDLCNFFRVSNDTLVHKAEKDLWRISEDKNGKVVIERLFNPDTKQPLKI